MERRTCRLTVNPRAGSMGRERDHQLLPSPALIAVRSILSYVPPMSITWQDLAFRMEPDLANDVAKAWSWLLPEPWEPIVCSMVAGVFLTIPTGEVIWLDTATRLVEQVAQNRDLFDALVKSSPEHVDECFFRHWSIVSMRPGKGQAWANATASQSCRSLPRENMTRTTWSWCLSESS